MPHLCIMGQSAGTRQGVWSKRLRSAGRLGGITKERMASQGGPHVWGPCTEDVACGALAQVHEVPLPGSQREGDEGPRQLPVAIRELPGEHALGHGLRDAQGEACGATPERKRAEFRGYQGADQGLMDQKAVWVQATPAQYPKLVVNQRDG
jgi:hypothetical protein